MVHLPTFEAMRRELRDNLQKYVEEHPGEFVIFERGPFGIVTTFYKRRIDLEEAVAKYRTLFGATFLSEQIPLKTHRFKENNKTLEFLDYFVDLCPNDSETKLIVGSSVTRTIDEGKPNYSEVAYCPDCSYKVFRRPSEEKIRRFEKNIRKQIGT